MTDQKFIDITYSGIEYLIVQDTPNSNTFSIFKNGIYHGYTTLDIILHDMHEV